MWSVIVQKLKEIFAKMIGSRTLEQTLHISPIISSEMETAIQLWSDMYKGNPPWVHEPTWEIDYNANLQEQITASGLLKGDESDGVITHDEYMMIIL